jgi:ammonium transporter Rh
MIILIEITLIVVFGFFVRLNLNPGLGDNIASQRYPAFQDGNVLVLFGFGFLMTFIRSYAWSALAYTFLINAFITQYYILLNPFWQRVF